MRGYGISDQRRLKFPNRRKAFLGIFLQASEDCPFDMFRDGMFNVTWIARRLYDLFECDYDWRVAREGDRTREHLEQDQP